MASSFVRGCVHLRAGKNADRTFEEATKLEALGRVGKGLITHGRVEARGDSAGEEEGNRRVGRAGERELLDGASTARQDVISTSGHCSKGKVD